MSRKGNKELRRRQDRYNKRVEQSAAQIDLLTRTTVSHNPNLVTYCCLLLVIGASASETAQALAQTEKPKAAASDTSIITHCPAPHAQFFTPPPQCAPTENLPKPPAKQPSPSEQSSTQTTFVLFDPTPAREVAKEHVAAAQAIYPKEYLAYQLYWQGRVSDAYKAITTYEINRITTPGNYPADHYFKNYYDLISLLATEVNDSLTAFVYGELHRTLSEPLVLTGPHSMPVGGMEHDCAQILRRAYGYLLRLRNTHHFPLYPSKQNTLYLARTGEAYLQLARKTYPNSPLVEKLYAPLKDEFSPYLDPAYITNTYYEQLARYAARFFFVVSGEARRPPETLPEIATTAEENTAEVITVRGNITRPAQSSR